MGAQSSIVDAGKHAVMHLQIPGNIAFVLTIGIGRISPDAIGSIVFASVFRRAVTEHRVVQCNAVLGPGPFHMHSNACAGHCSILYELRRHILQRYFI